MPHFTKKVSDVLSNEEKSLAINYLAAHPKSGALIQGTGGIRKLRWATGNKGKSSGIRVIYYYHNETIPLFLLTAFGKNEKDNLSKAERNDLATLTKLLQANYGE